MMQKRKKARWTKRKRTIKSWLKKLTMDRGLVEAPSCLFIGISGFVIGMTFFEKKHLLHQQQFNLCTSSGKKRPTFFFLSKSEVVVWCVCHCCMSWLVDTVFAGVTSFFTEGHEENDAREKKTT
jgi:hypothetical protein